MKALFVTMLAVAAMVGCGDADLYGLTIASVQLEVEVADTEESRARGLMYRESVPETRGMLFVFDEPAPRAFYMRNTSVPLSIAYIDERLVIRGIHDMEPFSLESVASRGAAMYALEVNRDAFDTWGVTVGDRLILSNELARRILK